MGKKSVLIIDDQPDMLEVMSELLEGYDLDVAIASSGNKAFEIISNKQFDYIISDINMPDGDGIELLNKVKKTLDNPPLFYFMTGYTDFKVDDLKKQGCREVFQKPLEIEKVIEVLERDGGS